MHGEQIAVTTMVMARLQDAMINGPVPVLTRSTLTENELFQRFGDVTGAACWAELQPKLLDKKQGGIEWENCRNLAQSPE